MSTPRRLVSSALFPKYDSVEEMQEIIDAFFEECKGHVLTDSDGSILYNRYGEPIVVDRHPPTVAGLALALGFNSKQTLQLYRTKPVNKKFWNLIDKAFLRIEMYAEERLYDRDGVNGAKFSLSNAFDGWNTAAEKKAEASAPAVTVINDIPKPAPVARTAEEDKTGSDE